MATTFHDLYQHVLDYIGQNLGESAQRDARRAIFESYRELVNAHKWSYLTKHGRIRTNPPYKTGTIVYDHTGGANEREVTLTGGTWPTWASSGVIVVNNIAHQVDQRVSNTVLTLDSIVNPGADIAAGTAYTIYQDTYDLPADFITIDMPELETNWGGIDFEPARNWLKHHRRYSAASGPAMGFTIVGSPDTPGRLAARLRRYPSDSQSIDFIYIARPRVITITDFIDGTVTTTLGSATVTGSAGTWTSAMKGSVMRISGGSSDLPTDLAGESPFVLESRIKTFTNSNTLVLEDSVPKAYSGVKYRISDPIDIEEGSMLNAMYRCCEKNIAAARNMDRKEEAYLVYSRALLEAKEADKRYFGRRAAGSLDRPSNWEATPLGADVT